MRIVCRGCESKFRLRYEDERPTGRIHCPNCGAQISLEAQIDGESSGEAHTGASSAPPAGAAPVDKSTSKPPTPKSRVLEDSSGRSLVEQSFGGLTQDEFDDMNDLAQALKSDAPTNPAIPAPRASSSSKGRSSGHKPSLERDELGRRLRALLGRDEDAGETREVPTAPPEQGQHAPDSAPTKPGADGESRRPNRGRQPSGELLPAAKETDGRSRLSTPRPGTLELPGNRSEGEGDDTTNPVLDKLADSDSRPRDTLSSGHSTQHGLPGLSEDSTNLLDPRARRVTVQEPPSSESDASTGADAPPPVPTPHARSARSPGDTQPSARAPSEHKSDDQGSQTSQSAADTIQWAPVGEPDPNRARRRGGSGFISLPTTSIRDAVEEGNYRLRIQDRVYAPVSESQLVQLIKFGAMIGVDEVAEVDGPWMPVEEHPVMERLRRKMAREAHEIFRELKVPPAEKREDAPQRDDRPGAESRRDPDPTPEVGPAPEAVGEIQPAVAPKPEASPKIEPEGPTQIEPETPTDEPETPTETAPAPERAGQDDQAEQRTPRKREDTIDTADQPSGDTDEKPTLTPVQLVLTLLFLAALIAAAAVGWMRFFG